MCVRPCVCPNAISSHNYGQISTLKVPMESLGPGGGYKTICRVIGPEMKKIYTMCVRTLCVSVRYVFLYAMCVRTLCVSVHYLLPHF